MTIVGDGAHVERARATNPAPVLGITGTGGAGKSSLVDELVRRFLREFEDKSIGVISIDPSKRKTGGALLGDRIRMNAANNPRVFMRSLATRQANLAMSRHVKEAIEVLKAARFDLVICDPPAFAPNKPALEKGLRAYERVARLAAPLVAEGGYLGLCSCSHAADLGRFRAASTRGIGRAGRAGQLIHTGAAGPDHPTHPQLAESSYLKALFFRLTP